MVHSHSMSGRYPMQSECTKPTRAAVCWDEGRGVIVDCEDCSDAVMAGHYIVSNKTQE